MEYTIIERPTNAFQQPITRENLIAMCQRAFGEEIEIVSAKELGGGLYNNTYLVHMTGMPPVILRVSPHPIRAFASESNLMRSEHASLPFLAPIAPLLPRTLMVDFTHQLLERDYLFQTYIEGEQWHQVMDEFTSEEKKDLWRQLGAIVKKIHAVEGDFFGNATLRSQFSSWSSTVIHWLTQLIHDLDSVHLDATDVRSILAIAESRQAILDEITRPHFLHGDLWTVNILVKRDKGGPKIVAVLDSDRTCWGDPMADWTMFLLHRNAGTEVDAFWETYGRPERSLGAQFRALIYQARYLGGARLEHYRLHHSESVKRSYRDMQMVIEALGELSIG